MKSNLVSRFIVIFSAIGLALLCIYLNGIKGGIDLLGGTDLIYQLEIPKGYQGDPNALAQQVIDVLRRRVDPNSVHNMIWKVLSGNRIEIQMPLASAESQAAQKQYQSLVQKLVARNVMPSQINAVMTQQGAQRQAGMATLAQGDSKRLAALQQLATAYDELAAANKIVDQYANNPLNIPSSDLVLINKAKNDYQNALDRVLAFNIDISQIAGLLSTIQETSNPDAQAALNQIIAAHPDQADLIKQLQVAYVNMTLNAGGLDNPQELERLLQGAGVLDFRISFPPTDPNNVRLAAQAVAQLTAKGPENGFTPPGTAWFEVDEQNGQPMLDDKFDFQAGQGAYFIGNWEGKNYVLLYTTPDKALTHEPGREDWKIENALFTRDQQTGKPLVEFNLDPVGAIYMRQLTSANIGQFMTILLDNKAIEAPTIQGAIGSNGEITLGDPTDTRSAQSIVSEGQNLAQILNAGSLPATLQSQPISVLTIGSTLGADNLRAGLHSAVIAVIVVLLFMFIYYTITGAFADMALMLNLLLLLGVMSMIGATFTLPAIAGVVLTLGMAVDANILINERIREELHKGASLWLAVKQGYDRVFWTIFDSNTTASLTSIVLIFVGSEDVKGFGITLLIGLAVHMFTALFVTRTLMIACIRWGIMKEIEDLSLLNYFKDLFTFTWLKGRWPFMRVITISNFDWISKRYYFWTVSAIIMVAGIIAFIARGNDKYDTEFNGGTQITLELKAGAHMPVDQVRQRVTEIGQTDPALAQLTHATIYSIGDQNNEFQIISSIVNPPQDELNAMEAKGQIAPVTQLTSALENKFADVIEVVSPLNFDHVDTTADHVQDLIDNGVIYPITQASLQQVIPGMPNVDISDYQGGVAIILNHISPADTVEDITARVLKMSQEPDFVDLQYRPFKVIPVTYSGQVSVSSSPPVTEAVIVAVDPDLLYNAQNASTISAWSDKVAGPEWNIIRTALTASGGLAGVTSFAPQVAAEARLNAVFSVLISLFLIVFYVWIRFGGIRYGLGVIFSLVHVAIVAVAATVLAVYLADTPIGRFLLVDNFKINMTMIAAYLTVIGYSVNDTIVIFDRVRENRGRTRQPLSRKIVNDSINQCFGRTVWTTFTVFSVVLILYVFGGEGVHGFAYAMLIGVLTGAYSTLAIASPMLLHVRDPNPPRPKVEITPYQAPLDKPVGA
ncbi:MAG TPA: protein translocase subunit SecD [Phycisphaerae bacterium]|nr:protein translocase subunit SecD [Phycisphaerae bacterium]